jgi:large conductance mechanosensitive channel
MFINSIVEFLIIAVAIYLFIKAINLTKDKLEKLAKKEEKKEEKVAKSEEVKLLEEIRNLLKKK